MAINPISPQPPSGWGRCSSSGSEIRLMNEWIRACFIESKAMVVVFVFLQTLTALSRDYYGPTSMVWAPYITSAAMVAEGVFTRCEEDILWRPSDLRGGSIKVTKLISLLVEANVNDGEAVPVGDVSNLMRFWNLCLTPVGLRSVLERVATDVSRSCFWI